MLDRDLLKKFEKVEVVTSNKNRGFVTITKDKRTLLISNKFIEKLPWIDGERLDLYRFGETFYLTPAKAGLLTFHAKKKVNQITSVNLCLEIMSKTHSCRKFDAWVEEDILFFKPWEGEE